MASKQTDKFAVQGLKELQKQLLTFDKDIMKKTTVTAAKNAMKPVASRAKDRVPVDSGALHDSIKVSGGSTDQGQHDRVAWAVVKAGGRVKGAAADPGGYVLETHYGTGRGKEANPFLMDAFEPHGREIAEHFRRELTAETKVGVDKMARRHKANKT